MRKISGVLLALAASLALAATTVAAKDAAKMTSVSVGVVAVRRCRTRARGANAIARVMHAPIAGARAVRVSVAASGTTAAKKSAVSQTFNGEHPLGGLSGSFVFYLSSQVAVESRRIQTH